MYIRWLAVLCIAVTMLASWPMAALAGPAPASTLASAPRMQSAPPGTARTAGAAEAPAGTVAVIPFTNISGNEADEWIGAGIAETVMADLESQAAFTVIVPARVPASGDRGTELDETAVLALGRELGAQWVVTGGYQRLGDQLRITARIADTATGVVARTLMADGVLDEIFALQDRIARELTTEAGDHCCGRSARAGCRLRLVGRPAAAVPGRRRPTPRPHPRLTLASARLARCRGGSCCRVVIGRNARAVSAPRAGTAAPARGWNVAGCRGARPPRRPPRCPSAFWPAVPA